MNRKVIILVISIIVVLIILSTTTYALFFRKDKLENSESYTAGILDIVIENDEEGLGETLNLVNSLPITDEEGKKSTPYKFKITNKGNLSYTFDLLLNNTTTSNQINADYIKIMVDNNEPVTLSSLKDSIIASDLTLNPGESKIISIRIWLDINTPNTEIGKSFSAKIVSNGVGIETEPSPNAPKLADNMIPIMYNGSNWVKADSTNTNATYKWYDYANKQWANAVLVSETNRSAYINASVGTVIPESDVLAYYVWIPRYKYKVWNITKTFGTDSYDAQNKGIDIVFEKGVESTGEITCNQYDFSFSGESASEICTGSNGQYYTHPAFTFGDKELEGIWIGKFEISTSPDNNCYYFGYQYRNCINDTYSVRIKPNTPSWVMNYLSNFYVVIKNMQSSDNEYGLDSDINIIDSHMLKNMEWGAVAYLTHSKYGICSGTSCNEIHGNNFHGILHEAPSGDYVYGPQTGCGESSDREICNSYDTAVGIKASSTGNIYGIYDLSGGAAEYVMANLSSSEGSYTYNSGELGSNFVYSEETSKYIDTYSRFGSVYINKCNTYDSPCDSFGISRLGDAMNEVALSQVYAGSTYSSGKTWNSYFSLDFECSWISRGSSYEGCESDSFFRFDNVEYVANNFSARASLAVY